jgi:hypothetical protein
LPRAGTTIGLVWLPVPWFDPDVTRSARTRQVGSASVVLVRARWISGLAALLASVGVVFLVADSTGAAAPPKKGLRYYRLTAVLKPEVVVTSPVGTTSTTSGRMSLDVDRNYRGEGGHVITPHVVFQGLTGSVVAVHIHAGRSGRTGRVVHTLCGTSPYVQPCTQFGSRAFRWSAAPFYDPALVGPTYVDVHTRRNPGGELRGQITSTPRVR